VGLVTGPEQACAILLPIVLPLSDELETSWGGRTPVFKRESFLRNTHLKEEYSEGNGLEKN